MVISNPRRNRAWASSNLPAAGMQVQLRPGCCPHQIARWLFQYLLGLHVEAEDPIQQLGADVQIGRAQQAEGLGFVPRSAHFLAGFYIGLEVVDG